MNNTLRVPLRSPADAEYRGSYVGLPHGTSAITLTENIGTDHSFDLGFAGATMGSTVVARSHVARAADDLLVATDLLAGSDLQVGLTLQESGQWVAVDGLVGDYGEGETCADAVQDLVVSLFEHRDILNKHRNNLHPVLLGELERLEASLKDAML